MRAGSLSALVSVPPAVAGGWRHHTGYLLPITVPGSLFLAQGTCSLSRNLWTACIALLSELQPAGGVEENRP